MRVSFLSVKGTRGAEVSKNGGMDSSIDLLKSEGNTASQGPGAQRSAR